MRLCVEHSGKSTDRRRTVPQVGCNARDRGESVGLKWVEEILFGASSEYQVTSWPDTRIKPQILYLRSRSPGSRSDQADLCCAQKRRAASTSFREPSRSTSTLKQCSRPRRR